MALDEIDQLFLNKTVEKLLLDLLKAHTTYGYDRIGVIGILIDDSIMAGLDSKISSVYNPSKVYFPPYSPKEVTDILDTRVRYGLYDGVMPPEVFDYIVERTVDAADMRVGIDILRQSTLLAEADASRKVTKEHAIKAYEKESRQLNLKRALDSLAQSEHDLLRLIAENDDMVSGELYDLLNKAHGTGIKKYNQIIQKLIHIRLIDSVPVSGRGQSRRIRLKSRPKEILALISAHTEK